MADMIDAAEARQILGCDDEALNNHINSGSIRAQRLGSKLMLNREDVDKMAKDDDGTIVLTGDSDNLSIDLGKVVDDTGETMVQSRKNDGSADSITFGDELEVVNFDDGNTKDLAFDDKAQTLNFTDSNTAVMTAVDETNVGATTAGVDFATDHDQNMGSQRSNESSRRSVRSNRARIEAPPVHWGWILCLAATVVVGAFFVLPYYFMAMWPSGDRDAHRGTYRGVADNGWSSMAGGAAGFAVEPDRDVWLKSHEGEYRDMKDSDNQAAWRYKDYRNKLDRDERLKAVIITKVSDDGTRAFAGAGKDYPVVKGANGDESVELGYGASTK